MQFGKTLLSHTSANGHVEAMKLLLDSGVAVDVQDTASTCEHA